VRVASPDPWALFGRPGDGPELSGLDATVDGDHLDVELPPFDAWALLVVDR